MKSEKAKAAKHLSKEVPLRRTVAMETSNPLSMTTKPSENPLLLGNQGDEASEKRKPLLMRRPRGSRRSDVSGHTLYTITSCSEEANSQTFREEDESLRTYARDDFISKPTNFATIVTDVKTEQLPAISAHPQNLLHNDKHTAAQTNYRSKTTYLPNIQMGSMARKNWINAEVKTFTMWHELASAKTDLKNSLPTPEMIRIEQMLEQMRRQRRTDPSAINFSGFAEVVKRENNLKHERHVLANPRYNTTLSLNKF